MNKIEALTKHVFELDSNLGEIGCRVETLSDIQNSLTRLAVEMNDAFHNGEEKFYFNDWHKRVRVLAELMRYTVNDLNPTFEETLSIHSQMFSNIRDLPDLDKEKATNLCKGK